MGSDWLAPVLSVMHERQFDWLTHALPHEKLNILQLLPQAKHETQRKGTQRSHNSVRQRMTSSHSKWMGICQPWRINAFQRVGVNALLVISTPVRVRDLSHERVGMRWSVRVDGSPFTLNGVTSSFAELNCGSVGFPCVAFHALLAARVEECSTFREAMHASANQIAFHA